METIRSTLNAHPFMRDMDDKFTDAFLAHATRKTFSENEYIFRQGDHADHFFLVEAGLVSVGIDPKLRSQVNIQSVTDGEVLGWSWLIPPYTWQFDAHALEKTTAIVLDAVKLRLLFENDHEIGYIVSRKILRIAAKRLLATRIQFWDIYKMHYFLEHSEG